MRHGVESIHNHTHIIRIVLTEISGYMGEQHISVDCSSVSISAIISLQRKCVIKRESECLPVI